MSFFAKRKKMSHYRPSLKRRSRKPLSRNQGQLFGTSFEKKQPKKSKKIWLVLPILAGTFMAIYGIFFSSWFNIKTITIKNENAAMNDSSAYENTLVSVKNKNLLFVRTEVIKAKIMEQYPELKNIEIKKILPDQLKITIEGYEIVANLINTFENYEKKFELNATGYLVMEDIENPELPYIMITTEKALSLKTQVIKPDKLIFTLDAIKKFEEMFKMVILDAKYMEVEREVHLRTEKHFVVWLDMEKDLDEQLNKLKKAIPKLDIFSTPLEYIDLRIAGTNNDKLIFKRL
ncbi:FtsQ-type POTRA domain-containing protein [Candidatus Peregrinibacteria bacterium]|nr:FtsQ-type POTRA domain-containing protein [Candidatus Peregrinibacteria bacterium]